jgi:hypothetical protein
VEELVGEVDRKEIEIRDLQGQKIEMERSLAQQSVSLKNQFDVFLEQGRVQHLKEIDGIKHAQEEYILNINDGNMYQDTLLEKKLSNLKLKDANVEESNLRQSIPMLIKGTQVNSYRGFSEINQIHYDLSSGKDRLGEKIIELKATQSTIIQVEGWEKDHEGHHLGIPRFSIRKALTYHALIKQWDNEMVDAS